MNQCIAVRTGNLGWPEWLRWRARLGLAIAATSTEGDRVQIHVAARKYQSDAFPGKALGQGQYRSQNRRTGWFNDLFEMSPEEPHGLAHIIVVNRDYVGSPVAEDIEIGDAYSGAKSIAYRLGTEFRNAMAGRQ